MTLDGKRAFLDAIRNGKGFIGCNTAVYTFIEPVSPGEKNDADHAWRYTHMIGGGYIGHNEVPVGSQNRIAPHSVSSCCPRCGVNDGFETDEHHRIREYPAGLTSI